jgi:hypothetical protein
MSGNRWTQFEFEVVVKKYCELWKAQQAGKLSSSSQGISACIQILNNSRNYGSIRMRFSNISYVFRHNNLAPLNGFKELDHISPRDRDLMWKIAAKELNQGV